MGDRGAASPHYRLEFLASKSVAPLPADASAARALFNMGGNRKPPQAAA
jgi:hypothetical protein